MSQVYYQAVRQLRQPAPTERREAVRHLEQEWPEAQLRGFARFARGLSAGVCVELCQALSHARSEPLLKLLTYYARREEAPLRRAGLSALEEVKGKARVPALLQLLESDVPETRKAACELLGSSGSLQPASQLLDQLEDPAPEVAVAALQALRRLGCQDCLPAVCELLDHDGKQVRKAAIELLVDLSDDRQFPAERVGRMALHDPSSSVRVTAAWALGKKPSASQQDRLLEIVRGEDTPKVRAAAAGALAAYPRDEVIATLVRVCGCEPNMAVTLKGRDSLSAMPDEQVLDVCRDLLRSDNEETRAEAALVLGGLNSSVARDSLLARLRTEPDPKTRAALVRALAGAGWEAAWDAVRRHVTDEPPVAHSAICALADLLDEDHVEDFVRLLDELEDVTLCEAGLRRLAAYARNRGLPASARPVLAMMLKSERRNLALLAAETAGWVGDRQMAKPLIDALKDSEDEEFVSVASRSVLKLYDGQVLEMLRDIDRADLVAVGSVLEHAESLGKGGIATCRGLARYAAKGYDGAAEALLSAARSEPGALLGALEGAHPKVARTIVRTWVQLPRHVRQGARIDWRQMVNSPSGPVRMLALDSLPPDADTELLPTIIAMAVEDEDGRVREVARQTAKRMVELQSAGGS